MSLHCFGTCCLNHQSNPSLLGVAPLFRALWLGAYHCLLLQACTTHLRILQTSLSVPPTPHSGHTHITPTPIHLHTSSSLPPSPISTLLTPLHHLPSRPFSHYSAIILGQQFFQGLSPHTICFAQEGLQGIVPNFYITIVHMHFEPKYGPYGEKKKK